MEKIKHLWKFAKYLTQLDGEAANYYRMYYVQLCRQLATDVELPKQNFGPSVMCSHCNSFWSKNESQFRIIPAKNSSKCVNKMINSHSEDNKLSRYRATLFKKSLKNKMNKVVIKCAVCLKSTEVNCIRPKRLKLQERDKTELDVSISRKKKKKRVRDKTAGLNISGTKSVDTSENQTMTPIQTTPTILKIKTKKKMEMTPIQKVRKMNIEKIQKALDESKNQKSKHNLSNFLKEIY